MADGSRSTSERWYSASELAGMPGLPDTHSAVKRSAKRSNWVAKNRLGRGGGKEYAISSLPPETQAALLLREQPSLAQLVTQSLNPTQSNINAAWSRYERVADKQKLTAQRRLRAIHNEDLLVATGLPRMVAREYVVQQLQRDDSDPASLPSLCNWRRLIDGVDRKDWLAYLLPNYHGRSATADCDSQPWEMLKALYLSRRQNSFSTCYRRVARAAEKEGWKLPCERTLMRRLEREVTPQEIAYLREGDEALERMYPPQKRDRSMFAAMQAINGDGVLFVPWCVWPTGEIARPKVWVWQCLGTGKILAWREDVSENTDMLRLAFGDLVEKWGLPRDVYIDNTMAAANTTMTGGVKNRYRFPVKDETIEGIMPMCGVDVHFVKPAHGQSKPIERAFKDLRQLIDHHPKYGKQGTKDKPMPIDEWRAIFGAEIAAHNAQSGRRGAHFKGRSFDQVFEESYAQTTVRKATAEQRRLWLLAADKVTVNRVDGGVVLGRGPMGENRYHCDALKAFMGQKVVVRFDPQKLRDPVHVYTLKGEFIATAECTWSGGFAEKETSRAYFRARAQFEKGTKHAAKAKLRMTELEAINQVPDVVPPEAPSPAVIEAVFKRPALSVVPQEIPLARTGTDDHRDSRVDDMLKRMQQQQIDQSGWTPPQNDE